MKGEKTRGREKIREAKRRVNEESRESKKVGK